MGSSYSMGAQHGIMKAPQVHDIGQEKNQLLKYVGEKS